MNNETLLQKIAKQLEEVGIYSTMIYKYNKLKDMIVFVNDNCLQVSLLDKKRVQILLNDRSKYTSNLAKDFKFDGYNIFVNNKQIRLN